MSSRSPFEPPTSGPLQQAPPFALAGALLRALRVVRVGLRLRTMRGVRPARLFGLRMLAFPGGRGGGGSVIWGVPLLLRLLRWRRLQRSGRVPRQRRQRRSRGGSEAEAGREQERAGGLSPRGPLRRAGPGGDAASSGGGAGRRGGRGRRRGWSRRGRGGRAAGVGAHGVQGPGGVDDAVGRMSARPVGRPVHAAGPIPAIRVVTAGRPEAGRVGGGPV
jgi:hypothetical protein